MNKNVHELIEEKRAIKPYIGWDTFVVKKDLTESGARKVFEEIARNNGSEHIIYEAMCSTLSPSAFKVAIEYLDKCDDLITEVKENIYTVILAFILNEVSDNSVGYIKVFEETLGKDFALRILKFAMETPIVADTHSVIRAREVFCASDEDRVYLIEAIKLIHSMKDRIELLSMWCSFDIGMEVLGSPSQLLMEAIAKSDEHGYLTSVYALNMNEKINNANYRFTKNAARELSCFLEHVELEDYFGLIQVLADAWSDIKEVTLLEFGGLNQTSEELIASLNSGDIDVFDLRYYLDSRSFMRHHSGIGVLFDRLEKQLDARDHLTNEELHYLSDNKIIEYIIDIDKEGKRKSLVDKIANLFSEYKAKVKTELQKNDLDLLACPLPEKELVFSDAD